MARLTPGRLAYLIAALLGLSVTVAIGIVRYADQQFVSVDEANAINDRYRPGVGSSFVQQGGCLPDAPDPERPCLAARLHNFAARARLIAVGIVLGMFFSAMAFRRSLDAQRPALTAHG